MSITTATEYAQSIADQITARTNAGYPFGVRHVVSDEEFVSLDDALEEFPNSPESDFTDASAMYYLEDVLDINYILNADRTYKAARICIAFGGPTAWINTLTSEVEAAWWSETVRVELPREFIEQLDYALEVLFTC